MSIVSLNTNLDLSGCECLNISDDHSLENCLTVSSNQLKRTPLVRIMTKTFHQDNGTVIKSDCDEQLIISLAFNQV